MPNNIVSFETAKRLEAAGFPRPGHLEPGQAWYDNKGKNRWINQMKRADTEQKASDTFAPTMEEIMKRMPSVQINFMGSMWEVCTITETFYHESGSEVAALGYFQYIKDEAEKKIDLQNLERGQRADLN